MTSQINPAVPLLEQWLDTGTFGSLVGEYIKRQHGSTEYLELLEETDQSTADEYLWQRFVQERRGEVVAGVEAVARGVLALARVDPEQYGEKYVQALPDLPGPNFPIRFRPNVPGGQSVTVFNLPRHLSGVKAVDGEAMFALGGLLGLKAVVLVAFTGKPQYTQLCLVLPHRTVPDNEQAYSVATFDLQGSLTAHESEPYLVPNGPLRAHLGLESREAAWHQRSNSQDVTDRVLGPGCSDLLRRSLGDLALYFAGLADAIQNS